MACVNDWLTDVFYQSCHLPNKFKTGNIDLILNSYVGWKKSWSNMRDMTILPLCGWESGPHHFHIHTVTHAQSKCPLCRSLVIAAQAISCHLPLGGCLNLILSAHLRSACSKTFIPISSFCASNSWELWNFGKKTIQWLYLLWKINSFYESLFT